jgi:polyisoprenoid-binding protein YceI
MRRWILWSLLAIAGVVAAGLAWLWFAGGSGEPSTDLTTPPLVGGSTTTTFSDGTPTSGATDPADGAVAFVIDQGRSTATYEVDEILRGNPNRVVGVTSQVAGQVAFDPADLAGIQFSEILVNARTFETDSSTRDRQVRGPIVLDSASDEFEFITFTVTEVSGLPASAEVGDSLALQVSGDLTIKGTTNEVTFDLAVSYADADTITGTASTTVTRSDFGIGIPQVPSVAGVDEEVTITLDFVAVAG